MLSADELEGHALSCPKYLGADSADALQLGMTE
jgi:hypothetical protein